ncbi:MAG: hypothetical protein LQ341_006593 [Variospora aurantia]|nr:MAG: hypothetical protein LQ341_006593 [Variospora aurantia]
MALTPQSLTTQHQTLQVLDSRHFSCKSYSPSGAVATASLLGVPEDVEMSKVGGVAREDTEDLIPGSFPVADVSLHEDTEGSEKLDVASADSFNPVVVPLWIREEKDVFRVQDGTNPRLLFVYTCGEWTGRESSVEK